MLDVLLISLHLTINSQSYLLLNRISYNTYYRKRAQHNSNLSSNLDEDLDDDASAKGDGQAEIGDRYESLFRHGLAYKDSLTKTNIA
jgi:hypothetical protein